MQFCGMFTVKGKVKFCISSIDKYRIRDLTREKEETFFNSIRVRKHSFNVTLVKNPIHFPPNYSHYLLTERKVF